MNTPSHTVPERRARTAPPSDQPSPGVAAPDDSTGRPARMRWHRPLLAVAAAIVLTGVISFAGFFFDDRELVGAPIWEKPFKFSISVFIYTITWAWLIGQLRRFRRTAWWAGTIISATLFIEMAVIFSQTVRGQRSHYNSLTPYDETMWNIMAVSIVILWLATLVAAVLLWFSPDPDRARSLAVRLASIICLVGLGLGFLMTIPSELQTATSEGIFGAHTVGAADGQVGIPILGWSKAHGDLRIPHFIGMHALQLIPLALIAIEFASRRVRALRDVGVRRSLVWTTAATYVAVVALVTWQAMRGQSIVQPDVLTLLAGGLILLGAAAGVGASLSRGRRRQPSIGAEANIR